MRLDWRFILKAVVIVVLTVGPVFLGVLLSSRASAEGSATAGRPSISTSFSQEDPETTTTTEDPTTTTTTTPDVPTDPPPAVGMCSQAGYALVQAPEASNPFDDPVIGPVLAYVMSLPGDASPTSCLQAFLDSVIAGQVSDLRTDVGVIKVSPGITESPSSGVGGGGGLTPEAQAAAVLLGLAGIGLVAGRLIP